MWSPQELEEVTLPADLADTERVNATGTVVWYVPDAPFATVECQLTDDNPGGLRTKLLDVPLAKLKPA